MKVIENPQSKTVLLAALTLLSWIGLYIHTTIELQLPIWRPENSVPALVGLLLFLGWRRQPDRRRLWAGLLLGWTVIAHLLLGAILSIVPLPLWPFVPEQTAVHYFAHVIYGVAQLPLIWVLWQEVKQ